MVFITPQPGKRPDDTKTNVLVSGTIISTKTPITVGKLARYITALDTAIYLVDVSGLTETGRVFIDNEEIE